VLYQSLIPALQKLLLKSVTRTGPRANVSSVSLDICLLLLDQMVSDSEWLAESSSMVPMC